MYMYIYIANLAIYTHSIFAPSCCLGYLKIEKPNASIRECLLFEFQLEHSAAEVTRNICQAKGQNAISEATTKCCFARFRQENYSLKDMPKSGRPTEINLIELQQAIESEPASTQLQVASKFGCTQQAVGYHFRKLRLASRAGQWTPHLSPVQRQKQVDISSDFSRLARL